MLQDTSSVWWFHER